MVDATGWLLSLLIACVIYVFSLSTLGNFPMKSVLKPTFAPVLFKSRLFSVMFYFQYFHFGVFTPIVVIECRFYLFFFSSQTFLWCWSSKGGKIWSSRRPRRITPKWWKRSKAWPCPARLAARTAPYWGWLLSRGTVPSWGIGSGTACTTVGVVRNENRRMLYKQSVPVKGLKWCLFNGIFYWYNIYCSYY